MPERASRRPVGHPRQPLGIGGRPGRYPPPRHPHHGQPRRLPVRTAGSRPARRESSWTWTCPPCAAMRTASCWMSPSRHPDSPRLPFVQARLLPEHIRWLQALPVTLAFQEDFFLCHGTPERDNQYLVRDVTPTACRLLPPAAIASKLAKDRPACRLLRPRPPAGAAEPARRPACGQPGQRRIAGLPRRPALSPCHGSRIAPCPLRHRDPRPVGVHG